VVKRYVFCIPLTLIVLLLLTFPTQALLDTFQNTKFSDNWEITYTYGVGTAYIDTYPTDDNYCLYIQGADNAYQGEVKVRNKEGENMNYFAFTLLGKVYQDLANCNFYIKFYNESGGYLASTGDLDTKPIGKWELVKSGSSVALYIDGEYQGSVASVSEDIYFVEFHIKGPWQLGIWIDDVTNYASHMIETIPHNWRIERNLDNPSASGVYN